MFFGIDLALIVFMVVFGGFLANHAQRAYLRKCLRTNKAPRPAWDVLCLTTRRPLTDAERARIHGQLN